MSLASWKKEFYPVSADEALAEEALEHSIRKWRGLPPAALKRHALKLHTSGTFPSLVAANGRHMTLGSESCALCAHHYDPPRDGGTICTTCPLAKARDGIRCTRPTKEEGDWSPWDRLAIDGKATPMLVQLRRARKEKP